MAGNYPDAPAPRVAYDRDGSVGLMFTENGFAYELSNAQLRILNNESSDSMNDNSNGAFRFWTIIFPAQRNLVGYFTMRSGSGNTNVFDVSTNSTNGIDGNWTTVANPWVNAGSVNPNYRTGITTIAQNNIKAVRFCINRNATLTATMHAIHLYGEYAGSQNVDRLRLWHPTLDEPLDDNTPADGAWIDWGDIARGTMGDKMFRYKNNSSTLTANNIVVSADILADTSPSVPPQFTFSDGGSFTTSLNIGNLAPGQISPLITVRKTTPANAALSVWSGRINANPGSWT